MKTRPCYLKSWDGSADRILVIEEVSKSENTEPSGPFTSLAIETRGGWTEVKNITHHIDPKTALELGEFLVSWAKENS